MFTNPSGLDTTGRHKSRSALLTSLHGDHTETFPSSPKECLCTGGGTELLQETFSSPNLLWASAPQGREAL